MDGRRLSSATPLPPPFAGQSFNHTLKDPTVHRYLLRLLGIEEGAGVHEVVYGVGKGCETGRPESGRFDARPKSQQTAWKP